MLLRHVMWSERPAPLKQPLVDSGFLVGERVLFRGEHNRSILNTRPRQPRATIATTRQG